MYAQLGTYGHTLGQANMVGYFASFIAVLPLERLVEQLDEYEMQATITEAENPATRRYRIRDREAAAIMLDAKRQLIALYSACGSMPLLEAKIRDSRPVPPAPIDPMKGATVKEEGTPRA